MYPKGPKTKDDDDEIDRVCEEHEDVDVSDGAVLWLDESFEELKNGTVERSTPEREQEKVRLCH